MLIQRLILLNYSGRTLNPGEMAGEEKKIRLQTKKNGRFNDNGEKNTQKSGRLRHKTGKEAACFGILLHLHSRR